MNICKIILFCLGAAMAAVACKSPSDKLMDDFKKVDSSLNSTSSIIDQDSLTLLAVSILAMQKQNPQLATEADSIYLATTNADDFIDSLKNVLTEKDATGDSSGVAMQLMQDNNTGGRLYYYLSRVCYYSSKAIPGDSAKPVDNSVCVDISEFSSPEIFIQKYFRQTPTIAAITILRKLKTDCNITAISVLNYVKGQLKYR